MPLLILLAAVGLAAGSYGWAVLRPAIVRPASLAGDPSEARVGAALAAPGTVDTADGRLSLDDRIAFWAKRVERTPGDFLSLVQLALSEAAKARLTADLGLYEQASRQLDQALELDPHHGPTLRAVAQVRFAVHDFGAAVEFAQRALARDPHDDGARAILGDALLELGRLAAAADAYRAISQAAAGPAVDARLARLDLVTGRVDAALGLARRAYDAALTSDDEDLAFYAYQLGETARQAGDPALARNGFEAALAVRRNDLGSLVGLARVDAAAGSTEAAIAGLRRAAAIAPQPETLGLLGDLLALGGDDAAAAAQYETVRAIARLNDLTGRVYDRQILLFELDHGGADESVLGRARAALAVRPDASGHDVVAWALYRLGRFDDALAESRQALASGTRDARILAHAGAIELATGAAGSGRRDLRAALDLGPALDPLIAREAARLLSGG